MSSIPFLIFINIRKFPEFWYFSLIVASFLFGVLSYNNVWKNLPILRDKIE